MSDPASRALDWTLRGRHGAPKALATLLCAAARGAGATPLPGADAERADAAHAWGASPWSPWWMAVVVALGWAAWWTVTQRQRRSQRRSEARLRESEERWKFALEGAGDGVWDANLALGTTLYSKRWKQILGYEEHEIGDAPAEWFGRIHPDDLPQFLAANRECVDGVRDGFVAEFRMRSKDGRWIWVLDRGKVLRRSANGKALRMIGTHTDISDRKATQARDAARAEIMTLIATGAALPVILQAIVRGVESRFDWLCSIMLVDGARGQLIIGAAPSLPAQFNQVVDGMRIGPDEGPCGAAVHHVRRQVAADITAHPRWRQYHDLALQSGIRSCWSEPVIGARGQVLGTFAAYHREARTPTPADAGIIGEAAQMASIAIERKYGESALRDSEERLQRALEASRLALWDLDLTTGKVFLSEAWAQMLGGEPQPTHTRFEALVDLVPQEEREALGAAAARALRGQSPSYSMEHRVRRLDGQLIWIVCQGRVVDRAVDGRARRAVGTNRDVSDRKWAEQAQHELEVRLREAQKLEAVGTLAGGIAHDFNNIMAAILGNVALARQDVGSGHPAQRYLEQISKTGQRARSLVQQILTFSRRQPGDTVSLSLRPLVEETVAMLRSMVGATTELRQSVAEQPLRVMGNATQLQQVLMNLGTNAWQALPGGAGWIEFGLRERDFANDAEELPSGLSPGRFAHLWVRDNGAGMDRETREHIFEPFFTTKAVGQGTGLGLAVVHGILEAHGGTVHVSTALGKGSVFDLYLPLVDQDSGFAPLDLRGADAPQGAGQHVLYIDDDEVMALMVQSLLQRAGYRATCLLDASAALNLVRTAPQDFDLVVTDYNMPSVSGLDVARDLRALQPNLPIVISSGYVTEELRFGAAEIGVRAVMKKENTFEELAPLVHAIVGAAAL